MPKKMWHNLLKGAGTAGYEISGESTATTFHIRGTSTTESYETFNINGIATQVSVVNGEFDYEYNKPLMAFTCNSSVTLTSIDFSDSCHLDAITNSYGMFYGCINLTAIDLGGSKFNSVISTCTNQQGGMFQNCQNLTILNIEDAEFKNATTIGAYMSGMFMGCSSLTSIYMPNATFDNLTQAINAFRNCGVTAITLNATFDKVLSLDNWFLNCTALVSASFPNATFSRSQSCSSMFFGCTSLTSLNMPKATFTATLNFGSNTSAWLANTKLETLYLPEATFTSVTEAVGFISMNPYVKHISLPKATFANVTNIGYNPSYNGFCNGCTNLIDISMPLVTFNKVTKAQASFKNCQSLQTFDVPLLALDSLQEGHQMFYGVNIPDDLYGLLKTQSFSSLIYGQAMFYGASYSGDFELDSYFPNLTNAGTQNIGMFQSFEATSISIPNATFENLTSAISMFCNCRANKLTMDNALFNASLVIAGSVYTGMFAYSTLSEIDLPQATFESVSNISALFFNCRSLSILNIPNVDFANVTDNARTFEACTSLTTIAVSNGVAFPISISFVDSPLSYQSLANIIGEDSIDKTDGWLADLTGETSQTLILNRNAWSALTTAQQNTLTATATAKNWTIAH